MNEAQRFVAKLSERRPVVTWTMATASVVIFGLQLLWGQGDPVASASRMGAGSKVLVEAGQVWRLLTVMVLHASFAHLAFNMVALFGFGTFLERFLGWRRYLLLYVVSGLGGSLVTMGSTGEIQVGPGSAGADPGPACYGRGGTQPTTTDTTAAYQCDL